ncbi:MAG: hypothetical protein EXX96DRAFT_111578 [Benjaminiella poitrasii]|nr:MAG: hypothetical protein EXX96DRAFT_111578 [Benjaminiella poitrasii]
MLDKTLHNLYVPPAVPRSSHGMYLFLVATIMHTIWKSYWLYIIHDTPFYLDKVLLDILRTFKTLSYQILKKKSTNLILYFLQFPIGIDDIGSSGTLWYCYCNFYFYFISILLYSYLVLFPTILVTSLLDMCRIVLNKNKIFTTKKKK